MLTALGVLTVNGPLLVLGVVPFETSSAISIGAGMVLAGWLLTANRWMRRRGTLRRSLARLGELVGATTLVAGAGAGLALALLPKGSTAQVVALVLAGVPGILAWLATPVWFLRLADPSAAARSLSMQGAAVMRTAYRVLAYLVAAEVVVQAAAMAFGVAGLSHWVNTGGVFDRAVLDGDVFPFPEVAGFIVHGINGSDRHPGAGPVAGRGLGLREGAARLLVGRGRVRAASVSRRRWASPPSDLPALGALHGINALLLFATALFAGRRARGAASVPVAAEQVPSAAQV